MLRTVNRKQWFSLAGDEPDDAILDTPKVYEPIVDFDQLTARLTMYQGQLNESVRGSNLDLVFFRDAMTHLVKVITCHDSPNQGVIHCRDSPS